MALQLNAAGGELLCHGFGEPRRPPWRRDSALAGVAGEAHHGADVDNLAPALAHEDGGAWRMRLNAPLRLASSTASKASSPIMAMRPSRVIPALFTRMSMVPKPTLTAPTVSPGGGEVGHVAMVGQGSHPGTPARRRRPGRSRCAPRRRMATVCPQGGQLQGDGPANAPEPPVTTQSCRSVRSCAHLLQRLGQGVGVLHPEVRTPERVLLMRGRSGCCPAPAQ